MTPSPPAGWYPDPQNRSRLRYWSGSAWSEHYAPVRLPGPEYASFGRRLLGFLIDYGITILLTQPVQWWLFAQYTIDLDELQRQLDSGSPSSAEIGRLMGPWVPLWAAVVAALANGAVWFVLQWLSLRAWQATPGMRVMSLSVRALSGDASDAARTRGIFFGVLFGLVGLGAELGLVSIVLAGILELLFFVGCLVMLSHPVGRTWHDRMTGTQVVDDRRVTDEAMLAYGPPPPPLTHNGRVLTIVVAALGGAALFVTSAVAQVTV